MIKNIIKWLLTLLGCGILIFGIVTEIDGIGRAAVILSGTVFSVIGSMLTFDRHQHGSSDND